MNSADAQGILGLTKDDSVVSFSGGLVDVDKKKKKVENQLKRPEGMHREVFNLLDRERNIASLMPSTTKNSGYRNQKARIGMRSVRPWFWHPFENAAREDGLQLFHWQRSDRIEAAQIYPFARFNKVINIPCFTDEEYDKYLISNKWTKTDTIHLFDLCRQFDLRWVVIVDRWEGSVKRTMEEMRERFYNAVNDLNVAKGEMTELLSYDAEHEKRRKEQLIKLWNRTDAEIEEEEMLLAELKKIEVRRRERERKAQDLQKLITAGERVSASPANNSSVHSSAAILKKKTNFRPKVSSVSAGQPSNGNFIAVSGFKCYFFLFPLVKFRGHIFRCFSSAKITFKIKSEKNLKFYYQEHSLLRFPEFRSSGAHLRSQEMKLPTNIGQKKLKNIETVIDKLKLGTPIFLYFKILFNFFKIDNLKFGFTELLPSGAEDIVTGFNELRSSVVLLQELKHMLQTAEYELESLRTRYNTLTGKTFNIEPRMRVATIGETGYRESTDMSGVPSSSRTITDMIELSSSLPQTVSHFTVLLIRKRKSNFPSSLSPGGFDSRRSRRT
ncbi:unnamed protein product [Dracunculus medinensis]|uniref:DNA methyltransferase 1-associated protein 1 n=1 Tax=Dracunculus medinensis TaxID=318479 RepID=A0A0N4U732_DRAME|nr:unnamed protein product [Dracunculus medinensis]